MAPPGGVHPGGVQRQPDTAPCGDVHRTPADAQPPQPQHRHHQRCRYGQGIRPQLAAVEHGDHHDRAEVVDDRQGEQEQLEHRRHARGDHGEHAEGEGDVGRHRHAPAGRAGAARVEGGVDRRRQQHATGRRHHRQGRPPPGAQLPVDQLTLEFQADHQEEQGHQPLVDPAAQVVNEAEVAEADLQHGPPEGLVGRLPGRVGPGQGEHGRGDQDRAAGGLLAEELPQRRRHAQRRRGQRLDVASR
jgi:hypothetical protein